MFLTERGRVAALALGWPPPWSLSATFTASPLRLRFHRAQFIEQTTIGLAAVRINGKRADSDEAFQAAVGSRRIQQVARRHYRIHERVRNQLFASPSGKVINHFDALANSLAVLARKKIPANDFHLRIFPAGLAERVNF